MGEIVFKCRVQVPFHGVLKNSKDIAFNKATGRRFVRSNDKALFAKKWLTQKLQVEILKQRVDMITDDLNAKFTFIFPKTVYFTKAGQRSKKIADISNLYQLPEDCLQKAGVIENDAQICSHDGSHRTFVEGTTYFLEIELTKIKSL